MFTMSTETEADASKETSPPQHSPPKKPEPKKRRRNKDLASPRSASKKSKAATSPGTAATATAEDGSVHKQAPVPPTRTLIIDNGGDTLKYGWILQK